MEQQHTSLLQKRKWQEQQQCYGMIISKMEVDVNSFLTKEADSGSFALDLKRRKLRDEIKLSQTLSSIRNSEISIQIP